MARLYAMQTSGPQQVNETGSGSDRSVMRKDRLDLMLAAASAGIADVPTWAIMELETYERADREMMSGENGSGSC